MAALWRAGNFISGLAYVCFLSEHKSISGLTSSGCLLSAVSEEDAEKEEAGVLKAAI